MYPYYSVGLVVQVIGLGMRGQPAGPASLGEARQAASGLLKALRRKLNQPNGASVTDSTLELNSC